MTSEIQKRDYQTKLISKTYDAWNSGLKNNLVVLPTGGGKSVIISQIILDGFNSNMSQVVMAHRNELVSQMSGHIANRGIPHKIIGSKDVVARITREHRDKYGRSFVNPSAPTAVIGVDTLMARQEEYAQWAKQVDRWVLDESHHAIGGVKIDKYGNPIKDKNGNLIFNTDPNKWGKAVSMFTNAQGLGVTATPQRADGQGLGREYDGVFDAMFVGPSMRELISREYLADYEIVCPTSDLDTSEAKLSKDGDWSSQSLRKAAKKSHIVGDTVENYIKFASGRSAIVFATDVETAEEMARKFKDAGIAAAQLNGKSNPTIRDKYINDFKNGILKVLVNVDLFDEGFDVPACDVVILARPTASLGKYLQMVGRALRYMPGKVALIIDQVSNIVRHGLPDQERVWTLARREKKSKQTPDPDEIKLRPCAKCEKPYMPFLKNCPWCGAEKPLPEPRERSIEIVDGDLILLDRETLERMRQSTILENPADVGARVAHATGNPIAGKGAANRQIEKIEAHERLKKSIAQWAAVKRLEGRDDREIQKMFYLTIGIDVLSVLDASKPRLEMDKLSEIIEGWVK